MAGVSQKPGGGGEMTETPSKSAMLSAPGFSRKRRFADLAIGIVAGSAFLLTLGVLAWIVWDLVRMGVPQISGEFLTGDVKEAGRSGGIGPVLASTFLVLLCCMAAAVPLGLGCAIWLSEFVKKDSRWGRLVRAGVDLLAAVPSIVFGLFGMAFFCQVLGMGFSMLAGGLTLACMILPILVRTALSALNALPDHLRLSSAALGMTRTAMLKKVLIPAALPGILVGVTLGVARALAETAALVFTSGYSTRWPSGLGDSGRALSVHIYDLAMNIPNGSARASASALVLLLLILAISYLASILTDRWLQKQTGTK